MTVNRSLSTHDVADVLRGRRSGTGWVGRCSGHQDTSPSLSIHEGQDGRVLLKCFSGCSFAEIVAALGVRASDLMGSARRRDDEHRAPIEIRSLTPEEEFLGNEILLRLWMCGVEVRVSPDHLRLVITPWPRPRHRSVLTYRP